VTATPWFQGAADVGAGGSFRARGVLLRVGLDGPLGERRLAGLALSYDRTHYAFSSPGALGRAKPWGDVQRLGVGARLVFLGPDRWSFLVSPSADFFLEDGADWGQAFTYGAVLAATRSFAPDRRIGIGLAVFDRLERTSVFPILVVDWRLVGRLRLANPLQAGPTGGAGLELALDLGRGVTLGAGAAYRSARFRLRDDGPFPDGIGEEHAIPVFVHAGARLGRSVALDVHAGALLRGALRVEDRGGHRIDDRDLDPAPLVGATASARF
jgi:hypothetical protein